MKYVFLKFNAFMMLIVLSILLTMPMSFATVHCGDSDGGLNYSKFGFVHLTSLDGRVISVKDDFCLNESVLSELYCQNDVLQNITYVCENGCKYGACVSVRNMCVRADPIVVITPNTETFVSGVDVGKYTYVVEITNMDSSECGSSVFSRQGIENVPLSMIIDEYSGYDLPAISPGESLKYNLYLSRALNIPVGNYFVGQIIENLNDKSYSTNATSNLILVPQTPVIEKNECVRADPIVVITPNTETFTSGVDVEKYTYVVEITNMDNSACGSSVFSRQDIENVPLSMIIDEYSGYDLPAISPGESLKYNLYLSRALNIPVGNYFIGQIIENSNNPINSVTVRSDVIIVALNSELHSSNQLIPTEVIEIPSQEDVIIPDDSDNSNTGETIVPVCNGCSMDDNCYPIGFRVDDVYCDSDKTFNKQLFSDGSCDNNFECSSNVCASRNCISGDFLQRIINWFKKLFSM